jgi:hypothetical protein
MAQNSKSLLSTNPESRSDQNAIISNKSIILFAKTYTIAEKIFLDFNKNFPPEASLSIFSSDSSSQSHTLPLFEEKQNICQFPYQEIFTKMLRKTVNMVAFTYPGIGPVFVAGPIAHSLKDICLNSIKESACSIFETLGITRIVTLKIFESIAAGEIVFHIGYESSSKNISESGISLTEESFNFVAMKS